MMQQAEFLQQLDQDGFVLMPQLLGTDWTAPLRDEVLAAVAADDAFFAAHNRPDAHHTGVVMNMIRYGGHCVQLLGHSPVMQGFDWALGRDCHLFVMSCSALPAHGRNNTTQIHLDTDKYADNMHIGLAAMVYLDDFTAENGATWYLPGSHREPQKPSEERFYSQGRQLTAPAGTVVYFNPRTWHASTPNTTDRARCALIIVMVRSWAKSRFDHVRMVQEMGLDSSLSEIIKYRLGFYGIPPASYEEYLAPPAQRAYRKPLG